MSLLNFIAAIEDINDPLHFYWEECYSELMQLNFILVNN